MSNQTAAIILGSDDRRQGIIAPDPNAHHQPPKHQNPRRADRGAGARQGKAESRDEDDAQLDAVHLSAAKGVGETPENQLADDDSRAGRGLEGLVHRRREPASVAAKAVGSLVLASLPKDDAQKAHDQVDGEDVVRVQEEADPGHGHGPRVLQAQRDPIYVGQGEPPAQVEIGNVRVVVCWAGRLMLAFSLKIKLLINEVEAVSFCFEKVDHSGMGASLKK